MIAYTLRAELRHGSVYIELLQNDDTFRGTLPRRFRSIAEAQAALLQGFGDDSVNTLGTYAGSLQVYRVQTDKGGLVKFGFPVVWVGDARGLRIKALA